MHIQKGFTLIELMVSIAIFVVIAMIAAPQFGDLIEQRKLDHSARELSYVLTDARAKATTTRKKVTIKFASGVNSATTLYWVPKHPTIVLDATANDVDFSDVVISPIGQVQQRKKTIPNPDYIAPPEGSTNPAENPAQLIVLLPLKFTLCNTKLQRSKTVELSVNGTVSNIASGGCS